MTRDKRECPKRTRNRFFFQKKNYDRNFQQKIDLNSHIHAEPGHSPPPPVRKLSHQGNCQSPRNQPPCQDEPCDAPASDMVRAYHPGFSGMADPNLAGTSRHEDPTTGGVGTWPKVFGNTSVPKGLFGGKFLPTSRQAPPLRASGSLSSYHRILRDRLPRGWSDSAWSPSGPGFRVIFFRDGMAFHLP